MRFGVTEHVWGSYNWFATNKGADKEGTYAGVPYDGNDPANWDLYHQPHDIPARASAWAELGNEPVAWKHEWLTRIKDLVDQHQTPKTIIDMLIDIVSRNGNLLLNFPLPNSGELDAEELKILDEITRWMAVNSEGIYSTRPWKIFGDGPAASAPAGGRGGFNEQYRQDFTAEEVRFTAKGKAIYAFVMGWPERQAVIKPMGTRSSVEKVKIKNVELLGFRGKVKWTQDEKGLTVRMPEQKPCDHAIALKIMAA